MHPFFHCCCYNGLYAFPDSETSICGPFEKSTRMLTTALRDGILLLEQLNRSAGQKQTSDIIQNREEQNSIGQQKRNRTQGKELWFVPGPFFVRY